MAKPLHVPIKETLEELELLSKKKDKPDHYYKRVKMLILLKKGVVLSKNALAKELKVGTRTIHIWRTEYSKNGIASLLNNNYRGKPGVFTEEIHEALREMICGDVQKFKGYSHIVDWLEENYNVTVKEYSIGRYITRYFGVLFENVRNSKY